MYNKNKLEVTTECLLPTMTHKNHCLPILVLHTAPSFLPSYDSDLSLIADPPAPPFRVRTVKIEEQVGLFFQTSASGATRMVIVASLTLSRNSLARADVLVC